MLCIAMMCTTSFEAQGQNRRSGGGGSSHSSSRTEHRAPSGHSGPSTKMSAPRNDNRGSQASRSRRDAGRPRGGSVSRSDMGRPSGGSASRNDRPSVNRTPRSNGGNISRSSRPGSAGISRNNGSRPGSAGISRNNGSRPGSPGRSGNMSRNDGPRPGSGMSRNNGPRPGGSGISRNNGPRPGAMDRGARPGSGRGPAVAHAPRPSHRGPVYSRPYLEPRHRPLPSYRYGTHYFGHRIHTLPLGYSLIRVGYRDYYYYDGIYYRPSLLGGYYVCRPPLGTRIAATLFDMAMSAIAINTIRNEIERAQLAAELSSIYASRNADYVVRTSDDYYNSNLLAQAGQDYFYQDGVFYTLKNGEYCVIEAPIGALVDEIPEDYDEIELGGKTYYQVEDTLFKPTIIDGKLRFEVACNL